MNGHLQMIQDVKTRWNSTYDMLARALTLKSTLKQWLQREDNRRFRNLTMTEAEWQQVRYLLILLKPFKDFTLAVSSSREASIHLASFVLQRLRQHLLRMRRAIATTGFPWASDFNQALDAAYAKLRKYAPAPGSPSGQIYNFAVILNPSSRLTFYKVRNDRE